MRRLLLVPLALIGLATLGLASANALVTTKQESAGATGAISKLTSKLIQVGRLHGHTLTCRIRPVSPGVGPFAVGDRVRIVCLDHVLVAIADQRSSSPASNRDSETTSEPTVTSANGPITGLVPGSISVQTMTCTTGPSSPSTAGFALGDSVRMYCVNGVLYQLKHSDTPPLPAPTTTTTTTTTENHITGISGTITSLGGSITVTSSGDTDDGPQTLTCTIGVPSPSTSGFGNGSLVRMYCQNGVLYQLKHAETPPPAPTTTTTTTTTTSVQYTAMTGTITTLAGTISVQGGDGGHESLTCTVGASSPSTSGFSVGNLVRMYCANGVLYALSHYTPPAPTTTTTTTTTTSTTSGQSGDYVYRQGTLTALAAGSSITVTNGDGSLTCSINASSPSTGGFAVGDAVRMYCHAGALISLVHPT
jgi:hypothetical protein